jgi:hypothetical protein
VINLLCDQPSNLLDWLLTFSIHNRMVVNTMMNHHSWHKLKFMHNIIKMPTIINYIKRRKMTKFASKWGGTWIRFDLKLEYEHTHHTKMSHCEW